MTSRQPAYALVPYTTLFRSPLIVVGQRLALAFAFAFTFTFARQVVDGGGEIARERHERVLLDVDDLPDRKSTRLNSSHSQISYAVFCLKKKIHYCSTATLTF